MYFCCMYLTKMQILSMLGTGYFLKIAKINSQEEKLIFPYPRKNFVPNGRMTEITRVTKMTRMNGMSGILG